MPTPMRIPNALIAAVKNREAVLFAGAGISFQALQVSAITLRDAIGADIKGDYADYDFDRRSVEDVCDEYAAVFSDRINLVNRLAGLIPKNAPPLPSHVVAVKLFRFIVTTNWDMLFEAAYNQIGQGYQCLATEADAPNFNYDQHNLLKIHGSVDRPLTLVATSDDYENYADTHKQLLDRITDLLHRNTVLFVGYGLRDEHVRRLLAHIRRERGPWARRHYAVGFYDTVRTELLKSRGIDVLPYDAADFLPALDTSVGPMQPFSGGG
jgi:NAD-dependent SIR2 family protein deacetylase